MRIQGIVFIRHVQVAVIVCAVALVSVRPCVAQQADSLSLGARLHETGQQWYLKGNADSLLYYCEAALPLLRETGELERAAAAANGVGAASMELGHPEKAKAHFELAERLAKEGGADTELALALNSLGNVLNGEGDLPGAIEKLQQAQAVFERIGDQQGAADCILGIGVCYDFLGDSEKALAFSRRGLNMFTEIRDTAGIARACNELGSIAWFHKTSDSALFFHQEALELCRAAGVVRERSNALANIAALKQKAGDYQGALATFLEALDIEQSTGNVWAQQGTLRGIAEVYLAMGNVDEARQYALQSYEMAVNHGRVAEQMALLRVLMEVSQSTGDYKAALDHYKRHVVLRDSITNADKVREIADIEHRFKYQQEAIKDSIQHAEEVRTIKAEKEAADARSDQRTQLLLFATGAVVLLLALALVIFLRFRESQRQKAVIEATNKELDARNAEKEVLLKEIHHRVKNNLQIISSLLDLQSKNIDDETALSAVSDGQSRVKSMALIHQKLYQTDDIANVNFAEYAQQLSNQLAALYPESHRIRTVVDASNIELDIDTAIPVGLILNELITNAYKYAYADAEAGVLQIKLEKQAQGKYALSVADTGPGLPADFNFEKSRSLGLRLVRRLSRQLYGAATYRFDQGCIFEVAFQDSAARKAVQ